MVQVGLSDMTKFLSDNLGISLLALAIGVSPRTVHRWQAGGIPKGHRTEKRLRATYQVFDLLQTEEAAPTIRAWFMGMNPQLDDLSPAEAIAMDKQREVMSSARAFLAGG